MTSTKRETGLLPCAHCGFQVELSEPDCCYPLNLEHTLWSVHCYQSGGGCGMSSLADTREGVIEKWNRRLRQPEQPSELADGFALRLDLCSSDEISDKEAYQLACRIAEEAIEALRRSLAQGARAPEGWRLVPTEPTRSMLLAIQEELPEHQHTAGAYILAKAQYRAMLVAAPEPTLAQGARWIPVGERFPTEADADEEGMVVAYSECQPSMVVPFEWVKAHAWEAWTPLPPAPEPKDG